MEKINCSRVKYIVGVLATQLILFLILFISAGRLNIARFWIFVIISSLYSIVEILLLLKYNPELIMWRGKPMKSDTIQWDKYLMRIYVLSFFILPAFIGLDHGRFHWSVLNNYYMIPGYFVFTAGAFITLWAMLVNTYFERSVRIQKDRNQKVITADPYKFIRHPGYLGSMLWILSMPFILGSIFGIFPALFSVIVLLIRTHLEDNALRKQLAGYEKYSKEVRYRLFFGIY